MRCIVVILCAIVAAAEAQVSNIVEISTHAPTDVRSAWLASGVRVHHKTIGAPNDDVHVTIRLVGGAINETDANRGVTSAAMAAWAPPRSRSSDAESFAKRLEDAGCTFAGSAVDADMVGMTFTCPTRRLGTALRLARELLTEPTIDEATLDNWKREQRALVLSRQSDPIGRADEVMAAALFPGEDVRLRPLTLDDIDALTVEDVAAWLENLAATSPIEVGVAGPVSSVRALEIVGRMLGDLPVRERITPHTMARQRILGPRPKGPVEVQQLCERCDASVALLGLYAPDRREVAPTQRIFSSLILLDQRLGNLDWGSIPRPTVEMMMVSGRAFPGYGVLYARIEARSEHLLAAVARVEAELELFAREGPTEAEMIGFRAGARTQLTDLLATPDFWSSRLAVTTFTGANFDELDSLLEDYTAVSAEDIRSTFAEYAVSKNRFTLVVLQEEVEE